VERKGPQGSEEPVLNIAGERVALGPLRADLLPLYGRWINDFGTMRMLGPPPIPVTVEKERDWYEGRARAENDLMFTIYERETLRPIGNTGLHGLDHRNRSVSFGIIIGEPECRGKGGVGGRPGRGPPCRRPSRSPRPREKTLRAPGVRREA